MKKEKIAIPKYTERKHASEQALSAQRMPSRTYVDRKKQNGKYACRGKGA